MNLKKLKGLISDAIPIREQVYHYLREEILNRNFSPNEHFIETKIAKQIGTSRTPVREAMHLLEHEGFLESIPRVGYRVKPITRKELNELRSIRFVNESLAMRWAIKRITQEEIILLEETLRRASLAIQEKRYSDFVGLGGQFHSLLSKASGSQRLHDLVQNLRQQMLRYRLECLYEEEVCIAVNQGHERLLEKVKALDEEGMMRELSEHLKSLEDTALQHAFAGKKTSYYQ